MKRSKEENRKKAIETVLSELRHSPLVIVEGKHDIAALQQLRIRAQSYERIMRSGLPLPTDAHIMMDNDRRGEEKAQKLGAFLTEKGVRTDERTGTRLLKLLNVPHVEDILQPIAQASEKATKQKTRKTKIGDIYGENLFGHS